jgi:hypothetical protein
VLVISPFGESIRKNFANRRELFPNYEYPNFELLTIQSLVTYSGLPDHFYPHNNWFETVDALKMLINDNQFDVALLGCGSYAIPLGSFISETMRKTAIYVGGVLQLYFGITGRRYRNIFFTNQMNEKAFIEPQEGARFLQHVQIDANTAHEAFGAYF